MYVCRSETPKNKRQMAAVPAVPYCRSSEIWLGCEKALGAVCPSAARYKTVLERGSQLLQPISFWDLC